VPKSSNPYIQSETYPVLYLFDGNQLFTQTIGILEHLSSEYGGEKCPKMIVVAIVHNNRMKDLLPVVNSASEESSDNFTEFLSKELIPYIDKKYPTQPYCVLMGHSLGGLRAANTLMMQPSVFNAYLALDPSLGHDMNLWSDKMHAQLKTQVFSNQTLFMAMAQTMPADMSLADIRADTGGMSRHIRAIMRFADGIGAHDKKGLHFNWKFYPEETHGSVTFLGTYEGLKSIFSFFENKEKNLIFDSKISTASALELFNKHYEQCSKRMGFRVLPSETSVDLLANYLMSKGMEEKAIAFAELNVKNYPKSEYAAYFLNYLRWADKAAIGDLLANKTAEQIYELCQKEAKKKNPEYNISEPAINEFAYSLLSAKKTKDALLFFKLNVELYPDSWNVYDGYGEVLLLTGKEKEGIAAYKKSLALNADNANAKAVLEKYSGK
jgi:predicted alpha/beta superfamily hydrolase